MSNETNFPNISNHPQSANIPVSSLAPFTKFCCSLGMIPSSYKMSMSYEEQLMWLCDYLENTVIPTVNNNTEATNEIQDLFNQLHDYVENYFTNLDVQQEINNKLDIMAEDGTLMSLIAPYLQPFINAQNQRINELENFVHSTTNINPLVATDITEMIDTTRIYVLTTNGHWYYYNGTTWADGGAYQSAQISNNSINLSKFAENIQDCFNTDYSSITLENPSNGYYSLDNNDDIVYSANEGFRSYTLDLDPHVDYKITYYNSYSAIGLIVVDENDNVLYSSNPLKDYSATSLGTDIINFDVPTTAYFSTSTGRANLVGIYEVNDVTLLPYFKLTLSELHSFNGYLERTSLSSTPAFSSNENYNTKIYEMRKGVTYNMISKNSYNAVGIAIYDNEFDLIYASMDVSTPSMDIVQYSYTATKDGYIMLLYSTVDSFFTYISCELNSDGIKPQSKLYKKLISCNGDSIMATGTGNGGIPGAIQRITNCTVDNIAVGGGTIAYYNSSTYCISRNMNNMNSNADFILLEGGVNDYFHSIPLGSINLNDLGGYDTTLDDTTFYGALESMFRYYMNNFADIPIAFVIPHKMQVDYINNDLGLTFRAYREAIYNACQKYGIMIIDIAKNTALNTVSYFPQKRQYMEDNGSLHPTQLGYDMWYAPYTTSCIESLVFDKFSLEPDE